MQDLETTAIPIKHNIINTVLARDFEGKWGRTQQPENFIELVKQERHVFCEPMNEEAIGVQKKTFKAHVKKKIRDAALTYLKDIQNSH